MTTPTMSLRAVLIAITAAVTVIALAVWLVPRLGDDAPGSTASGQEPVPESDDPEPVADEPEPEPIMFGPNRYTSPCHLLPLADVERIFAPLGPDGNVGQTYYADSLSKPVFNEETDTVTRSVRTVCDYNFGGSTISLQASVAQYRNERAAKGQWASIAYLGTGKESKKLAREEFGDGFGFVVDLARENEANMGGQPVKGAERTLLYVPGQQNFVTYQGNLVITLTYSEADFIDEPLTPKEYSLQAPRMKKAAEVIRRQFNADLEQGPLPTVIGSESAMGETPYLEPCQLLDIDAFKAATGRKPGPEIVSTSLIKDTAARRKRNDDLYARSPYNSCERKIRWEPPKSVTGRSSSATLEVRYAEDEADSLMLLERHIMWKFFDEEDRDRYALGTLEEFGLLKEVTGSAADAMYFLDSTVQTGKAQAFTHAYFTVGPYEFLLDAERNWGLGFFDGDVLTKRQYTAAVNEIVANVREQMESQPDAS